jgi:hypothetical protein
LIWPFNHIYIFDTRFLIVLLFKKSGDAYAEAPKGPRTAPERQLLTCLGSQALSAFPLCHRSLKLKELKLKAVLVMLLLAMLVLVLVLMLVMLLMPMLMLVLAMPVLVVLALMLAMLVLLLAMVLAAMILENWA